MSRNYLRSCQTLYAATGLDQFPVRSLGTCFYAVYRDLGMALTAHHVLKGESADTLLAFAGDDTDQVVHFLAVADMRNTSDWSDFVVLPVDRHSGAGWHLNAIPISTSSVSFGNTLKFGGQLGISGMPAEERTIDYEANTTHQTRFFIDASYVGPDPDREHVHMARVTDNLSLETYNGLSGSPVLLSRDSTLGFSGLVLQGHPASRLVHFVSSAVILRALEASYSALRQPNAG